MSKISNDLLKSANEANKVILRAKDKAVTLALSDPLVEQAKTSEKKEAVKETENDLDKSEEVDPPEAQSSEEGEGELDTEHVCTNNKNLEDEQVLRNHPDICNLLTTVEDMLVDYPNSDKKTMESDSIAFQEEITQMMDKMFQNKKNSYMYTRYQRLWVTYYALVNELNKHTSKDLLDQKLYEFFVHQGQKYTPSTLYVMYSCINYYFIVNFGYKLNTMLRLQRFLKLNTSTYAVY